MPGLGEARQAVADAVTSTGLVCTPYPAEAPSLPAAFVDQAIVGYENGQGWFCAPGAVEMTLVTVDQRNDVAASISDLEGYMESIVAALVAIGAPPTTVTSGTVEVGGQSLPSVTYSIRTQM